MESHSGKLTRGTGRGLLPVREGRETAKRFEGFISSQPHIDVNSARRDASIRQACLCARIADEYRGRDIRVLDLTGVTPIFDFFVLTTATSARQARAIADEVDRVLSAEGSRRLSNEGSASSSWILQDFGDIVLHVFTAEARKLYDLENLWADAVGVDWQAYLDGLKSA
jgi:ribosome-associated protein